MVLEAGGKGVQQRGELMRVRRCGMIHHDKMMKEGSVAVLDVRERQRFETGFFDCRAIQLSLALQEWGMPVEALYYNAWESTKEIYEHLYVKKSKPWLYHSPCLEPSELELIGIPYEQVPYADEEEIAPLLQRLDYGACAAFLWISCGEALYANPGTFGDPEAAHSIWVCGWSPAPGGSGRYAIRDTYPDYEGDISEEDLRRMWKVPAYRAVFLLRKPKAKAIPDWCRIRERYADRMAGQQGDYTYYEIVRANAAAAARVRSGVWPGCMTAMRMPSNSLRAPAMPSPASWKRRRGTGAWCNCCAALRARRIC
ncbi:hypothetical protein PMJ6TS7_23720 [Paenibacillus melissococcoides]